MGYENAQLTCTCCDKGMAFPTSDGHFPRLD